MKFITPSPVFETYPFQTGLSRMRYDRSSIWMAGLHDNSRKVGPNDFKFCMRQYFTQRLFKFEMGYFEPITTSGTSMTNRAKKLNNFKQL